MATFKLCNIVRIFLNKVFVFQMYTYLKSSHISRIAGVFQTILIALQEEFKKKSETMKKIFYYYGT